MGNGHYSGLGQGLLMQGLEPLGLIMRYLDPLGYRQPEALQHVGAVTGTASDPAPTNCIALT